MSVRRSQKKLNYKTKSYKEWGEVLESKTACDMPWLGVKKGDTLLIEIKSRYEEGKVGVWQVEGDDFITPAYGYNCFGDVGLTNYSGRAYHYHPSEVTFIGEIASVQVPFTPAIEQTETLKKEITVICECGAKLTGRPDFLKGMGWQIKKDSTLCAECR